MLYYRIKENGYNENNFFVKGSLLTKKELKRKTKSNFFRCEENGKYILFSEVLQPVEVSRKKTFFFFGARWEVV